MSARPTTSIRVDPKLRSDAARIFEELGLSTSSAINSFLQVVVRQGRLPFEIGPNTEARKILSKNQSLNSASASRKDEFYTSYDDVEAELSQYSKSFNGKKVYCNCDDPLDSAFMRYFVRNFNRLGLRELVATSYSGSKVSQEKASLALSAGAQKAVITKVVDSMLPQNSTDVNWESLFNFPGNYITNLVGDGDFRSTESIEELRDSDVIVTNPPFSLFRDYIKQLLSHQKDFIILGNMNATTYKEVFPLFKEKKVWYGVSIKSGDRKFYVPDDYPLDASGCGLDATGRRFVRVKGVRWFTNIASGASIPRLELSATYNASQYPKYDNYDAINVDRVMDIPKDYDGVIGVPITFLDKFDPNQFEILMLANGNARTNVSPEVLGVVGYAPCDVDKGGVGVISGKRVYVRILIRKLHS